jgi:hypothetical protein
MHNEITQPTLVPALDPAQESMRELSAFLVAPHPSLIDFLSALAFSGGTQLLSYEVKGLPVFRTHFTSGYNYTFEAKMLAYVRFGVTDTNYLVVQAMLLDGVSSWVSHYYSADGKYSFSEGSLSHRFVSKGETLIESECPVLNHVYNILSEEYAVTKSGKSNTKLIYTLEKTLRRIQKTNAQKLSISLGIHDPAIKALNDRLMAIELDPVYSWKERRSLFISLKEERTSLINTKKRAHQKSFVSYTLPLVAFDAKAAFERFKKRPYNNTLGLLESLFIDPIRYFCGVVRGNMGYAIAMAIYSPFTFFFISQPLNPHAMSVVGVVRSAYLQTTDAASHLFGTSGSTVTTAAAVKAYTPTVDYRTIKPANGSLLVSSDAQDVATQSWDERMSNFKSMEISYEGNMEVAPRLGRLEQMETQLNWPLIVESAWLETERYLDHLNFLARNAKDYTPEFNTFVHSEIARADQVQLYLWDRNVRFILDHPFTMMDQSSEQTQNDYYVGRSFILLRDITNNLAAKHHGMPNPAGYDSIMKLAQKFDLEYKSGGSVLDRLKANSKLFAQNDKQSTDELRSYMKREWEILYLLQNHTQEASNTGLQVYIWSVRNAVYTLQSLYSTKLAELSMIELNFKKGATVNKLSTNEDFKHIDSQYEALFHMMVLEYTSVRKEIGESLKKDIESIQRKEIIGGVESFLKERDTLLRGANLI